MIFYVLSLNIKDKKIKFNIERRTYPNYTPGEGVPKI